MIGEGQATAADGWAEAFRAAMGNEPPDILFWVRHDQSAMLALPPGVTIGCMFFDDGTSLVRMFAKRKEDELANFRIMKVCTEADMTKETTAIASAIYWSHWRHLVLVGKRPPDF